MRKSPNTLVEKYRRSKAGLLSSSVLNGNNGIFVIPRNGVRLLCVVSDQLGWDHISVTVKTKKMTQIKRCPTWDELSFLKDLFFEPEEVVVQLHVPDADHISVHDYCLHLWRKQGQEHPLPPSLMV